MHTKRFCTRLMLTVFLLLPVLMYGNAAHADPDPAAFSMAISRNMGPAMQECMALAAQNGKTGGVEQPMGNDATKKWIAQCAFAKACPKAVAETNAPGVTVASACEPGMKGLGQ